MGHVKTYFQGSAAAIPAGSQNMAFLRNLLFSEVASCDESCFLDWRPVTLPKSDSHSFFPTF